MVVDSPSLDDMVEQLAAAPLDDVSDRRLAAETATLLRAAERLRAQAVRRVAELDRRAGGPADQSESVARLVRRQRLCTTFAAREMVRVARRLQRLPDVGQAFLAGRIGYEHVRLIARTASDERIDAVAGDQAALVDAAQRMDPRQLRIHLTHWRHATDPQEAIAEAEEVFARRRLDLSGSFDDGGYLDGELDAEGFALLRAGLSAAVEATRKPDDQRTRSQRNADALVELSRSYLDVVDTPISGGERPHLVVTVDLTTLRGDTGAPAAVLEDGTPITGEAARRLACDASVSRIILDGDSLPIDVGRATRTIPAATRRALVVRDRGCVAEGCSRRARSCDAHHIRPWALGGRTDLDGLALLCRHHHRLTHEGGWRIARERGRFRLRPPPGPLLL